MAKSERLEDLGKISIMLEHLCRHELFELYEGAPKRFNEWWEIKPKDEQEKILNKLAYCLEDVYFKICEIACVADGDEDE